MMRHALLVAALVIALAPSAAAQHPSAAVETVTVVRRMLIGGDLTPAEAKRRALEQALAEGVARVLGVHVQSAQLGVTDDREPGVRDSFLSVVHVDAAGRATDYKVLSERYVTEQHRAVGEQLYLELKVLVAVAREHGRGDAGFTASLSLNDALFFDGGGSIDGNDEVVATITSSRDAWLTVFSIAGDSAHLLLPNALMADRRIAGGKPVELPSREWRDRGVHFRASLPPGERSRRELLLVVATRSPISFTPAGAAADTEMFSLMEVQRWLVTIPLHERALADAAYEVRRK